MILTILKKELRSYFNSPIAYVMLVVFLGVSGWFFTQDLLLGRQADISGFINIAPILFLLLVPGLCMRLIAEERSQGTIEVLATLPLKDYEIVLGKWLAAFLLILVGLAATLLYPLTTSFLGKLDFGVVIGSYLGLIFLGMFFTSIGIFCSALSPSQIVAFVVGVFISFFFFVIGKILFALPSAFLPLINYLGLDSHLASITRGVIDTRDIIYFLSFSGLFLFGAIYFVGRVKEQLVSTVSALLVIIIFVLLNFVSERLFTRLDLTEGNIYSLTRASVKIIRELPDYLLVRAYITEGLPYPYNDRARYVRDLLSEYRQRSGGKVKFEFLSPNPKNREEIMMAQQSGVIPLQFTEVKEGEFGIKQGFMGLVFLYEDKREVIPVIEDLANLEYDITSRIKKLVQKETRAIGFTKGHDEIELDENLKRRLSAQYKIEDVILKDTLGTTTEIGSQALVILGPKKDFEKEEIAKLRKFIDNKGAVAFLLDHYHINLQFFFSFPLRLPNLDTLLANYGVSLGQGLIMDRECEVIVLRTQIGSFIMPTPVSYPYFPTLTKLSKTHPITRDFEAIVLPYVSPVIGAEPIAQTSNDSWLRNNPQSLNPFDKEKFLPFALPFDQKGPFSAISYIAGDKRLLFMGTARFLDPQFMNDAAVTLFFNILDWLTQDEALIAIRSKTIIDRPLKEIKPGLGTFLRWFNTLVPCFGFIAIGFIRWRIRKGVKRYG